MLAQHIELIGIGERHLQTIHRVFDRVEPLQKRRALGRRMVAKRAALDSDQCAIPTIDT